MSIINLVPPQNSLFALPSDTGGVLPVAAYRSLNWDITDLTCRVNSFQRDIDAYRSEVALYTDSRDFFKTGVDQKALYDLTTEGQTF